VPTGVPNMAAGRQGQGSGGAAGGVRNGEEACSKNCLAQEREGRIGGNSSDDCHRFLSLQAPTPKPKYGNGDTGIIIHSLYEHYHLFCTSELGLVTGAPNSVLLSVELESERLSTHCQALPVRAVLLSGFH